MSQPFEPAAFNQPSVESPKKKGGSWTALIVILVLLLVGGPVCVCGGCVASVYFGVMGVIKGTEPYKVAVETASSNPLVQEQLGTPVAAGMGVRGNVNMQNDGGDCDLSIPISGPKGSGTLIVRGTRNGGVWSYDEIYVEINGETIDIQP